MTGALRRSFTFWAASCALLLGSAVSATQDLGCMHHAGAHGVQPAPATAHI